MEEEEENDRKKGCIREVVFVVVVEYWKIKNTEKIYMRHLVNNLTLYNLGTCVCRLIIYHSKPLI